MSILGYCECRNFKVVWHCIDYSMVPRACQCSYCLSKGAAYVSKQGSRFELSIVDSKHHKIVQQGSQSADFHECSYCGDLIAVTASVDDQLYGILNSRILHNKFGFSDEIPMDFDGQSKSEKLKRWKKNWCYALIK